MVVEELVSDEEIEEESQEESETDSVEDEGIVDQVNDNSIDAVEPSSIYFSFMHKGSLRYLDDKLAFGPKSQSVLLKVTKREGLVCFEYNGRYLSYSDLFMWSERPALFIITFDGRRDNPITCREHQSNRELTCHRGQLAWGEGGVRFELTNIPSPTLLQYGKEFLGRQRNTIILILLLVVLLLIFFLKGH